MATVVLHFEYKDDGNLGRSGPGDTLRLSHALRHRTFANERLVIVTCSDPLILEGLLGRDRAAYCFVPPTAGHGRATGVFRLDATVRLLTEVLPAEESLDRIVHAFVGFEFGRPIAAERCTVRGRQAPRFRIDGTTPRRSCMFHSRWEAEVKPNISERVLGATVREEVTAPNRNTPMWFCDVVRRVSKGLGWTIDWFGGKDNAPARALPLQAEERFFAFGDLTMGRQITTLAGRMRAATGWNSGGLDLASVAGIPVLRGGEFQRRNWGERYNSFLAVATNIGLEPRDIENADRFAPEVFEESLTSFLIALENNQLQDSRHAILRDEEPLRAIPELEEQLEQRTVKWATRKEAPEWWA